MKTGIPATIIKARVPVAYESGPVNLALSIRPEQWSGLSLGDLQYSCLRDASICPAGLTVSAWVKASDPRNRERFFGTNPGSSLGVLLVSYRFRSRLTYLVQGSKHRCLLDHFLLSFTTWVFASATWIVQPDGTGKLVFYLIDDTGVKKIEKACPEDQFSFQPNSGKMKTVLHLSHGRTGFSIDELAVWNATLTEDKILGMYDLVTSKYCVIAYGN